MRKKCFGLGRGWRMVFGLMAVVTLLIGLAGCLGKEGEKVRELDSLIISEEALPSQLKGIIDEKKEKEFQFTFSDQKNLYICIGYGKQETGGYSIVLNDLYLTDAEVVVDTTLLGPDPAAQAKKTATYPFIVIRTELVEQPVVYR